MKYIVMLFLFPSCSIVVIVFVLYVRESKFLGCIDKILSFVNINNNFVVRVYRTHIMYSMTRNGKILKRSQLQRTIKFARRYIKLLCSPS